MMSNLLISYRYSLFALFLVFNAIICSVAVWNYTITQALLLSAQIDVYLAVIGGLAVLFIIPITFIDVFRKNALTGRVWFELLWTGLFWILELCGAAAFTADIPDTLCTKSALSLQPEGCTSSRVLQGFTWLTTILLLFHLLALFVSALLHYDDDREIWGASVRFYSWYSTRSVLGSTPSSPTKPSQGPTWQRPLKLKAPQPTRPARPADLDLEAAHTGAPAMQETSHSTVSRIPAPPPVASMYPAHVAATMGSSARAPPPTGATPPPLGDWPRSMRSQTSRAPRFAANVNVPSPITEVSTPAPSAPATSSHYAPQRPMPAPKTAGSRPTHQRDGSRGGSRSPTRRAPPPPLDLTRISAYNAIEERRKQLR